MVSFNILGIFPSHITNTFLKLFVMYGFPVIFEDFTFPINLAVFTLSTLTLYNFYTYCFISGFDIVSSILNVIVLSLTGLPGRISNNR